MRLVPATLIAGVLAVAGCGGESGEEPLTVGAASSLRTALTGYAVGGDSPEETRVSFAGSDLIASQIRQGARIDVFAAASTAEPDSLHRDGLVGQPVPYARNEIVIGVPAGSDIASIDDLAEPGLKLVIGDDEVPVGDYARDVIDGLPPATASAIDDNVKSEEPDVASITAKLVQGAADAGLVYSTDVLSAPGKVDAIPIPRELQPEIVYSAAVVTGSDQAGEASAYIDGLLSGRGAADLKEAGFLPPP